MTTDLRAPMLPRSLAARFRRTLHEEQIYWQSARQGLEAVLRQGCDAGAFLRAYGPLQAVAADYRVGLAELHDAFGLAAEELEVLEREVRTFHELLTAALDHIRHVQARPLPDPAAFRAAEEAYARGETKPFRHPATSAGGGPQ